ncbi:JmjC domain, hydroxylase-domain-containing protein [Spinellus fusiger]|nr:JmjC domain, hydroxylase-domain-containing protein [Spinellus fusiger]
MDQFKDFKRFMESIDSHGKQAGIVKVIPPKEWKNALPDISSGLEHVRVHHPIIQHIIGSQGVYTQTNIEKRRPYTLNQWYSVCEQSEHRSPDLNTDRTCIVPVTAKSNDPVPLSFDPHCVDISRYTVDYCKEVEREYWRNLTFTQPMYGADMIGTLFDTSVCEWNVNKLDNLLNRLGVTLPGVNTPYLYFGMWKSTFAWHVEDMDLYSINYLHVGAPKQWYAIPTTHYKKFESIMQNIFFQQYKACHEFLRHKTFIVSPKVLANHGIPVQRCVQYEGEFMITFPFGYHSGYNLGFNCAESVNFALDSWLEIGKKAKACSCINDSVTIDVSVRNGQKEKDCVLCPNRKPADMLTVEGYGVHRLCAEAVPDTYTDTLEQGICIVKGFKEIPNARWKLICQYCHRREGACTQCCSERCCRAFHATCAMEAGATMIRQMTEDDGRVLYDVYCSQHDPVSAFLGLFNESVFCFIFNLFIVQKFQMIKQQEKQHSIDKMAEEMRLGREVSVHWNGAEAVKGMLLAYDGCYSFHKQTLITIATSGSIEDSNLEKQTCRIMFEDGIARTMPWREIRFNDI